MRVWLLGDEDENGGGGGGGGFLGPLHREGLNLVHPGGVVFKCRGFTGFRFSELAFRSEWGWIDEYLGCIRELGGNALRDFTGMWDNTNWNCYRSRAYDQVERGFERARDAGIYIHSVFFCNQRPGGPNCLTRDEQDEHVRLLGEAARRSGNIFGEIENETLDGDNTGNASLTSRFSEGDFGGLMMTRSTWNTGDPNNPDPQEVGTWMGWATFHPPRDVPEFCWESAKISSETQKTGLGPYPAAFRPAMPGEPIRIAEGTTPSQWAALVFHALNLGLGIIVHGGFHSFDPRTETDLQNCKFPNPGEPGDDILQAIRQTWNSPLINARASSDGAFKRAGVISPNDPPVYGDVPGVGHVRIFPQNDGECPIEHWDKYIDTDDARYIDPRGAGRNYWQKLPDGTMIGGPIDRGDQWELIPRLGYHLAARDGYEGCILVMER